MAGDAVELAMALSAKAQAGDWAGIQERSTVTFRSLPADAVALAMQRQTFLNGFGPHLTAPADWGVETYDDFVLARAVEHPARALVFRLESGGELRYDPGPIAAAWAEIYQQGYDSGDIDPRVFERGFAGDPPDFQTLRSFRDEVRVVRPMSSGLELAFVISFSDAEVRIPRDGIVWSSGDQSGAGQVAWTNARLTEDYLELVGDPHPNVMTTYVIGILLPEAVAAVDEVRVDLRDVVAGDRREFTRFHVIPLEKYPSAPDA